MEDLIIKGTESTPEIIFDYKHHVFEFKGVSYPGNTRKFYEPVITWLNEYFKNVDVQETTINIDMYYFNSSSLKVFFNFFNVFDRTISEGKKIIVNWYFDKENDNGRITGEEFKEHFMNLPFNIIKKE